MKHVLTLSTTLAAICIFLFVSASGQGAAGVYRITDQTTEPVAAGKFAASTPQSVMAKNAMTAIPLNYKYFTKPYKTTSKEAAAANAGYENHPEAGMLYPGTPCDNCYELIGQRTETTKTFQKEGVTEDGGKDVMKQTSTMPMHYLDAAGNWRTITINLQPDNDHKGVYAAMAQPSPVIIDAASGFSSIGKAGENIRFNNNLELIYVKPDGSETSLGVANWSNHTAGDDGAYVTNAWPGVDIEMHTVRGAVKTSFYINHAMPAYANGKLLIRDHVQTAKGLSLVPRDGTKAGADGNIHTTGVFDVKGTMDEEKYAISVATVFEHADPKNTFRQLEYILSPGNALDIALPGSYLNRPESAYPIVVDPLVSVATGATPLVNGASYNATWAAHSGCEYIDSAWTPINSTLTDIQFSFAYITTTVAMDEVGFTFYLGTCASPGTAAGYAWSCNSPLPGTCTSAGGVTYSIWAASATTGTTSGLGTCVSAPSCPSYPLNIEMYFFQNHLTTAACATTYVMEQAPLIITVFGHTVELTAAGATASPTTVCAGSTSTLTATGTYGVPPYSYSWTPGPVTGSPAVVTPTVTTVYTVTVTDACGITATGHTTVNVYPIGPIEGDFTLCVGNSTTLTDAVTGGTWSSSTTTVATAGSTTGLVSGISSGTATITYSKLTSTTGPTCKVYAVVTVTPLPAAITGTPYMCVGATTTLNDATPGDPWSSSNTAIATVSTGGVVTGIAAGTATITYGGAGCDATITVTVNPTPDITSSAFTNPTTCNGTNGTITLSGLVAGSVYTVNYTGPGGPATASITADGTGNITITGLGAGTYSNITVTNSFGCTSNIVGPFVLVAGTLPAAPVLTNNSPMCAGGIIDLTATDTSIGITYSWHGPAGYTTALQDPTINSTGMSGTYTYTCTVTTASGCTSLPATTVVTINPVPVITLASFASPTTCGGSNGSITLDVTGLPGGGSYITTYLDNGLSQGSLLTSTASGDIVIAGLKAGNYDSIYITTHAGCVSNMVGPVVLSDPGAPPPPVLRSNEPVCVGQTLDLYANDSVQGGIYTWKFANGDSSVAQNTSITSTTYSDTGIFIVTYNVANCISSATINISLYPPIILTNITPTTTIQYGSNIQLNVDGALYYWWLPDDGTLSDPNINNPIATPLAATTYTVVGTSTWGCKDTAEITIKITDPSAVIIPSAFTPNNDGLNDIFRLANLTTQKLVDFSVFNRWGQLVYHNASGDAKAGWDGTFSGVAQDMGVYNYFIILSNPDGTNQVYKGDVTLIR